MDSRHDTDFRVGVNLAAETAYLELSSYDSTRGVDILKAFSRRRLWSLGRLLSNHVGQTSQRSLPEIFVEALVGRIGYTNSVAIAVLWLRYRRVVSLSPT